MEKEDLFELITKMYADLKNGQDELKNEIKKTNISIENDIRPKIEALFDSYKQNSAQLARIENEVSRQEEVILRRIK